jgi:hypothetical protein
MGRPIQKKYFANTNYEVFGSANVGGESVASVTVVAGDSANYDDADTVAFSAPQITGGVTATGTLVLTDGSVTGVTVTNGGSGYTSAPTLTITTSTGTQTTLTLTAVLTSGASARQNGIKCEAQVGAGSEVTTGDVIKQTGSKRYKVQTSDGTAICKLVTTADLGANEMSITATDSDGGTYYVRKLTARKVVLVAGTGTQFATGASAKWTFGSAVANTTVSIANQ